MAEEHASRPDMGSPVKLKRRRLLAPYDYTIEGARLGNLTGKDLKALVERLQHKSGSTLAEQLMAENRWR